MIVSLIALMVMVSFQPKSFSKTCNSISDRFCAGSTDCGYGFYLVLRSEDRSLCRCMVQLDPHRSVTDYPNHRSVEMGLALLFEGINFFETAAPSGSKKFILESCITGNRVGFRQTLRRPNCHSPIQKSGAVSLQGLGCGFRYGCGGTFARE